MAALFPRAFAVLIDVSQTEAIVIADQFFIGVSVIPVIISGYVASGFDRAADHAKMLADILAADIVIDLLFVGLIQNAEAVLCNHHFHVVVAVFHIHEKIEKTGIIR